MSELLLLLSLQSPSVAAEMRLDTRRATNWMMTTISSANGWNSTAELPRWNEQCGTTLEECVSASWALLHSQGIKLAWFTNNLQQNKHALSVLRRCVVFNVLKKLHIVPAIKQYNIPKRLLNLANDLTLEWLSAWLCEIFRSLYS